MAGERVPGEDQGRVRSSDGRDERGQACFADGLCFFDPADVDAFDAFDALEVVVEASEDKTAAVDVADAVASDFEALQSEFFDGSGEELVDGVGDGVLEFTGAEDGDWLYRGS
nr:MAG: hypothetical protein [Bacteriophage sp.]